MNVTIQHDPDRQQFYVDFGTHTEEAHLIYDQPQQDIMDFVSTFVPEPYRDKGVARQLVKAGLDYAKEKNRTVIATCPVVEEYLNKHQEEYDEIRSA
ncbi:hypothetical protein SAMN05421823_102664 [Catalinimonas alkaloidigena]|uniref:N-acetyltransferase domain-containing protein n=1 Tax=Catalinimonas alkaloidigena TaxID=1075417 RepID=A0A1G9BNX0_9BACT|nr:GNAT family N-acetyltransferase [Catalinimonas alkaloidigena]SDK40834.1 hypothetical protein SAMN05421823_102664 [Catalinimonas alkaloidigena]